MTNILVTDANYKHTLGIVRALGGVGLNPYVLSFKKYSLAGLSRYSKGQVILKSNYELKEIIDELKRLNIDLIMPVGTNSFKKLTPWKYALAEHGINMVCVNNELLEKAFSKVETYRHAQNVGVPIPNTIYPKKIEEVGDIAEYIEYPCVIKGLYEVGGNIVDYAKSKQELVVNYIELCKRYNIGQVDGLPMIQEYIPGSGCAFFAVYDNGKCGITFQHKRIREYPVTGGSSVCAESYTNELVESYGRKLLDSLEWHGVAMVEFKLNKKSEPILMEINPKFWGSTDLALESGVNFPKAVVDIHEKKPVTFSRVYEYPSKYHWPLQGDLMHGLEKPSNLVGIIKDFVNPNVKSNIWIKDPFPTTYMMAEFIVEIFRKYILGRR